MHPKSFTTATIALVALCLQCNFFSHDPIGPNPNQVVFTPVVRYVVQNSTVGMFLYVQWNSYPGATRYNIFQSVGINGPYSRIGYVTDTSATVITTNYHDFFIKIAPVVDSAEVYYSLRAPVQYADVRYHETHSPSYATTTYEYNLLGKYTVLNHTSRPADSINYQFAFQYDAQSREEVWRATLAPAGWGIQGMHVEYAYNTSGELSSYDISSGTHVDLKYNANHRPTESTASDSGGPAYLSDTWVYDASGRVVRETVYRAKDDVSREMFYAYDSTGRMQRIATLEHSSDTVMIQDTSILAISYGPAGRIASVNKYSGALPTGTVTMVYDGSGFLIREESDNGDVLTHEYRPVAPVQ